MKKEMTSLPRWVAAFLKNICPKDLFEEIEGDLIQRFNRDQIKFGHRKASQRMTIHALKFLRPGILLRNRFSINFNQVHMIRNYFVVARRQLWRNKVFSMINVSGLAVGLAAFFLILQYVSFETSFDQFHPNSHEIYRVALERYTNEDLQVASAEHFSGVRKLIRDRFPEIKQVTGFYKTPANTGVLFHYNGKIFNELGGELNADTSFFKVFPGLLLRGDPSTVLNDAHNIVLSERMARKIFGDTEPVGQHLAMPSDNNTQVDFVVTGILKDIPANAHFHANFVVSLNRSFDLTDEWKTTCLLTYVTIKDQKDMPVIEARLNGLLKQTGKENPEVKGTWSFLQPISSIHLSSNLQSELETNGSKALVLGISVIGLIILVIAWINYVNLETARFVTRAREVGVRRIIGSGKADLTLQFLIEYFCILILAAIVAIVLVILIQPHFSSLTGIPVNNFQWLQPEVGLTSLTILLTGSFFVGVYPAIFLLRLNPVATLKGNFGGPNRGSIVRKSLIVVQFTVSLALIAFVLVVHDQLDFMRLVNKKFDVEQVLAIRNPTAYSNQEVIEKHTDYQTLGDKLSENPAVKMVASSSAIPGTEIGFTYINLLKRNINDPYDPTPYKTLFVDHNYIPFYGIRLLAGHNFNAPRPVSQWINPWEDGNWNSIILNEQAIHALGFRSAEEAVDQLVEFENFADHFEKHKIIGVIADYHHEAVKKQILPMILSPNYGSFQQVYYSIRLQPGTRVGDELARIERSWKEVFPEKPFDYFFLDEYYDRQFKSEKHFAGIFSAFSGIAVFIACLGIFGMTLFEANSRLKEISIRKVLGASVGNLIRLLSHDHIRIVLLSSLIAGPIIYFAAEQWLTTYPIRIELSPVFFMMPFAAVAVLVFLTSAFQTVKAANTNPVNHLKNE
jgi:putative ABC transport system permease protein